MSETTAPYRAACPQSNLLAAAKEVLDAHRAVKDSMKPAMLPRDFAALDVAMERQQSALRNLAAAFTLASLLDPGNPTSAEAESDHRQEIEARPESCLRCRGCGTDKCARCHGTGLESEAHRHA